MDGRWNLCLAGGLLAGLVGCNTTRPRPGDQAVQQPNATPMQVAKGPQPPPPISIPRTALKPSTYVTMGALKEQAADDADRPQPEREAYRIQARQSYQKATEVDPKYTPAYVALANSYLASGDRAQAQAMFKKATELAPKDANLWYEQGAALARAKDWPAAIEGLTRATELDPKNKAAQRLLGFTLARGGWYEPALNALAKVMPEAEARYNLARMMEHNQQGDAAQAQLQFAVRADPTYEPARAMLAERGPAGDPAVRQAGYQAPAPPAEAPPAAARDPQPGSPPRLPPVSLGGGAAAVEPARVGVAGSRE